MLMTRRTRGFSVCLSIIFTVSLELGKNFLTGPLPLSCEILIPLRSWDAEAINVITISSKLGIT